MKYLLFNIGEIKKRTIILLISVLTGSIGNAQNDSLKIKGKISNCDNDTFITLMISNGNILQKKEVYKVEKDSFNISYRLKENPSRVRLIESKTNKKITFWTENDAIEISGNIDDFSKAEIKGANYTESESKFKAKFNRDSTIQFQLNLIEKYINTPSAVYRLSRSYLQYPIEEVQKLYSILEEKWKVHDFGLSIKNYLLAPDRKSLQIGDKFPELKGTDQRDSTFSLNSHRNDKFILLEFSSYACPWSRKALPIVKELNDKFKDKLELITYVQDTREEFWRKYSSRWETNWMKIWDGYGEIGKQYISLGIKGTPKYFLLNPQGEIIDIIDGFHEIEDFEKRINKGLKITKG